MKLKWTLSQNETGLLCLEFQEGGRFLRREVVTVSQASALLGRTTRQVYRYIKEGVLSACGKCLNEWLLDADMVRRSSPLFKKSLRWPAKKFAGLFPEYGCRGLNPYRDSRLILSRLLDKGGLGEIRWAFESFPRAFIGRFVEQHGAGALSPRALKYWSLILGVTPKPGPSWRSQGRRWGGNGR